MELAWIRTWVAVVDAGGFARAAAAIHLSQPRVSAHIANLERTLGVTLIERRARPFALTDEGRELLPKARAILDAADAFTVRTEDVPLTGSLRVASFASGSAAFLPHVLSSLRDEHPDLTIAVLDGDVDAMDRAVDDLVVSVSLRPLRPEPADRALTFHPLWREPFVALVPPTHVLAEHASVTLDDLASEHLLTIGNPMLDEPLGWEAAAMFQTAAVRSPSGTTFHQPTTLVSMVSAGLGVGVVNLLVTRLARMDGVVVLPIDGTTTHRDVGIWWHPARGMSRAARAFIDAVRSAPIPDGMTPLTPGT